MNTVTIEGNELIVEPKGMDKVWGFRRRLRVPLAHVRGATADTGAAREPRGVRAPGLSLPGKYVGTFHREGEAAYWNVSDPSATVVVEFREEDLARAVLTVEDPTEVERLVNAAVSG